MKKEKFERLLAGTGEAVDMGPLEPHLRAPDDPGRLKQANLGYIEDPWRNDPCPCSSGKKAKKCCLPH